MHDTWKVDVNSNWLKGISGFQFFLAPKTFFFMQTLMKTTNLIKKKWILEGLLVEAEAGASSPPPSLPPWSPELLPRNPQDLKVTEQLGGWE